MAGRAAVYIAWSTSLCFEGRPTVCAGDATGATGNPTSAGEQVQKAFAAVEPTADLADKSTWPTAYEALPR